MTVDSVVSELSAGALKLIKGYVTANILI